MVKASNCSRKQYHSQYVLDRFLKVCNSVAARGALVTFAIDDQQINALISHAPMASNVEVNKGIISLPQVLIQHSNTGEHVLANSVCNCMYQTTGKDLRSQISLIHYLMSSQSAGSIRKRRSPCIGGCVLLNSWRLAYLNEGTSTPHMLTYLVVAFALVPG